MNFSPKINILDLSKNSIEFSIENVNVIFINTLRRIILSDIPSLNIQTTDFIENTTNLVDEYILHRLGLIPLVNTDTDKLNTKEDCDCISDCNKCCVYYTLDVSNNFDYNMNVFSHDLKLNFNENLYHSFVPIENILIAKLAPGQTLRLKAKAFIGTGKEHAKHSVVCPVSYRIENDKIIMSIETNETIEAINVFLKSLDVLKNRLELLEESI